MSLFLRRLIRHRVVGPLVIWLLLCFVVASAGWLAFTLTGNPDTAQLWGYGWGWGGTIFGFLPVLLMMARQLRAERRR